ncbi:MAG: ABC transporter ATP-binding protein [Chitinophagaceae bacterium]
MPPLLQVSDLSIDFISDAGVTPALKNVSLTLSRNEILALVGESGSGKSVTSLSILRLLPTPPARYTSGSILFSDEEADTIDLLQQEPQTLQHIRGNRIAMIFQEPMTSLNPVFTCGYQVTEAIRTHRNISGREARRKAIEWFTRVKLPQPERIFRRYPHELSGGQKQRVMIAMAMCCQPALLICDEPTTALDVTVQKTILQLIKELQQESGMGVIFITHDLGVVAEIADRVAVMYRGEIVEQGTVQTIFTAPQHPYTKGLLACRPVNHQPGERLPVVSDFINPASAPVQQSAAQTPSPLPLPAEPAALLRAEQLSVWFPVKKGWLNNKTPEFIKAVDEVSFTVYKGETLGLVGESGCGKTTLGRALLRLIEPTAGRIWYNGLDLTALDKRGLRALRRDMQIIFQDPYSSLNPRVTIGDAIMEPLQVHRLLPTAGARKERVMELLKKVDLLPAHFNRYPHEFSGGQRQRIVIARALALNPSFIICDESVAALDVSVQSQVLNLLNDLKKEFGFTTIFISHDLAVVRYISDRIMVMNKGKIEETGPAGAVYFNPQSSYTQRLIASIPKGLPTQ